MLDQIDSAVDSDIPVCMFPWRDVVFGSFSLNLIFVAFCLLLSPSNCLDMVRFNFVHFDFTFDCFWFQSWTNRHLIGWLIHWMISMVLHWLINRHAIPNTQRMSPLHSLPYESSFTFLPISNLTSNYHIYGIAHVVAPSWIGNWKLEIDACFVFGSWSWWRHSRNWLWCLRSRFRSLWQSVDRCRSCPHASSDTSMYRSRANHLWNSQNEIRCQTNWNGAIFISLCFFFLCCVWFLFCFILFCLACAACTSSLVKQNII